MTPHARRPLGSFALAALFLAFAACAGQSSPDAPATAGPDGDGGAGVTGEGGVDSAAASCTDKIRNGTESDVDCGGSCPSCDDGKRCGSKADCASGVCPAGTCAVPTCKDGVANGGENGVDCGGPCPATYHGAVCVNGTAGSQVCSSFPNDGGAPSVNDAGAEMFDVKISWNATGGNGYVNYVLIYTPNGETYNSSGIFGGSPNNVCTSGPYTESFKLPLGDQYTYKIWYANCGRPDACSGCGYDTVIAQGGPFGIARDLCR